MSGKNMKIAVLSDIHSNLEALTACLEDISSRGVDGYAFLGDLIGYCADPGPVVDIVMNLVEKGGIAVQGNHDSAVVSTEAMRMNIDAETAIGWTKKRLNGVHLRFLGTLPLSVKRFDAVFVHASADAPGEWIYIKDAQRARNCLDRVDSRYVFAGHTHEACLYSIDKTGRPVPMVPVEETIIPLSSAFKWLCVTGSVGQPRDGDPRASYSILDFEEMTLTIHRVRYDWDAAAKKIRAAGLPERLANRLACGT